MSRPLDAKDVRLARGKREILRGVNLHADAGEVVALMGLSGSGKTTMLRAIATRCASPPDNSRGSALARCPTPS